MKKVYIWIFCLVIALLYSHSLILYGVMQERVSRVCVSPEAERKLNDTIDITKKVCIDMAKGRLEELNLEVENSKKDTANWKKKYIDSTSSTADVAGWD